MSKLQVQVEYWFGSLPLQLYYGVDGPSDGVIRVYLHRAPYTMILSGFDNYWFYGNRFGYYNDPQNYHRYIGRQEATWCWPEDNKPFRDEAPIPPGAILWRGVMMPDDEAREVGVL